MKPRLSSSVLIAVALPVLLAVAVAVLGLVVKGAAAAPDTRPLAIAPIDSPAADGPECTALLAALPAELDAGDQLAVRPLAEPAPAGVRAWAATPRPVVLRCGLPRPAELGPASALLEVNGVRWLTLDDGLGVVTHIAVDRPVYVALTTPSAIGGAPLQHISETVRQVLPPTEVMLR